MEGFAQFIPYLKDPLTLVGFALFLVFGTNRLLIRSGIIPPLSARSGSRVLQSLLRYGLVIALVVIALGFGLEYFKTYHDTTANEKLLDEKLLDEKLLDEKLKPLLDRAGLITNTGAKHVANLITLTQTSAQDRESLKSVIRDAENLLSRVKVKPNSQNLVLLGHLYLSDNDFEKAIACYLDAIEKNPSMSEAYAGLAIAYQVQATEYIKASDSDHATKALDKAEENAKIAWQYDPSDATLLMQIGFIEKDFAVKYSDEGSTARVGESLDKAEKLLKLGLGGNENEQAAAHNGLGDVFLIRGNFDKAINEYETATKMLPDYTAAWNDLVLALKEKYVQSGQFDGETLKQTLMALKRVFELQGMPNAQHLPPQAFAQINDTKDWALKEAEKFQR
jgi:tetratricopeptide (TPR) repeat protein